MKWQRTVNIISTLFLCSSLSAFADSNALIGKIEHNQLDPSVLDDKATNLNYPKQANYSVAISKLLAGYDLSSMFKSAIQNEVLKGSAQNTTLKSSVQPESTQTATKAIDSRIGKARTIQDVLANHDLCIIFDRSGSMASKDCPGGLSRWEWCSKQASSLAQAAAQASSTITLMFFNNDLQIFDNINPKNLPTIFTSYSPGGGTVLSAPLTAQLDRYFSHRDKPLIIVVITDGIPQDTTVLAPMIKDASNSLHYIGEVTISFLLIGSPMDAEQFRGLLGELDGGSIKNGGMVDVIAFKTLVNKGIKQTLFDELKTITITTNKSKLSNADQFATGKSILVKQPFNLSSTYSTTDALTNPFPKGSLAAATASAKLK